MDQPSVKYLPGGSSFACFLQDGARPSVIDGQSQFSFTLLASLRDRLFLTSIETGKPVVVLFFRRECR